MKLKEKFKILTYNVGIIKKDIARVLKDDKNDIIWLKHDYKDRFFADPFLIKQDDDFYYLLVEEYPFKTEKGVISLLKVEKKEFRLIDKQVVIEEPYHLSFPFCEENGNTIIPESVAANETYVYTFDLNTMKVVGKKKLLDVGLIDGVYYKDYLFASKKVNPKLDLYSFKMIKGAYRECNNGKPVISSIVFSRSAGRFFECNGVTYRPTQDCEERYGKRVQITKVEEIKNGCLSFTSCKAIDSSQYPPYDETMHTFNVYDGFVIVDGSKDFVRFPMKAFYKLQKKFSHKRKGKNE